MPKIVDHQAKRASILESCFELFARRGYDSVTMREIAGEVGVSTGTLYHYFKTKDDILHQMFEHMSRRDVEAATAELSAERTPEDRTRILFRFIRTNEKNLQRLIFLAIDYLRQKTNSGVHDVREVLRNAAGFYRRSIGEQLGLSGSELENILFSFILGILLQRVLDEESTDYEAHLGFLLGILPYIQLPGEPV